MELDARAMMERKGIKETITEPKEPTVVKTAQTNSTEDGEKKDVSEMSEEELLEKNEDIHR
jgi:hypothetical protein